MKALVTGATGLLGGELVALLLEMGVEVRLLLRPSSPIGDLPAEIIRGDVTNQAIVAQAVAGIDWLFHAAGHLTADAPFGGGADSPLYQQVNVDWTAQLLAAGREAAIARFIYVSSSSVYDLEAAVPTPEEAPLRPGSPYGRSKLLAEARVNAYQANGMATTIIRPAVIYGPKDRYFTPLALGLARWPWLPLVNGGRQLFDLVYVRDVARLMVTAAQTQAAIGRVYNAGPGRPTTLRDLVMAYQQITGRGPRLLSLSPQQMAWSGRWLRPVMSRWLPDFQAALSPAGIRLMSHDLHLAMGRAKAELNYQPIYDVPAGLRETLQNLSYEL